MSIQPWNPLSKRARLFLSGLKRVTPIPTKRVETLLSGNYPPNAVATWLSFHERYAGYIDRTANDASLWGIAHHKTHWQMMLYHPSPRAFVAP